MKTKICILVCLVVFLYSCTQPREAVVFDFFLEFPHAQVMAAEDHRDLFQTWTTRSRMFGWTRSREVDKTALLVSTNRERAVFRFGAVQRKDQRIRLKLRCLLPSGTGPAFLLSIHLNGHPVHSAPFYGADFIRAITEKGLFSRKTSLELPANTALAYVLKIPPEASLAFEYSFDAARQDSAYGERFVIGLSTWSGESAVLFDQDLESGPRTGRGRTSLDLSAYRDQVCRVSFAFLSDLSRESSPARIQISNAGIWTLAGKGGQAGDLPREAALSQPFNILIYLVDCLRPDHLPFFGYSRDTAPHMAEFVKDSVLFRQAYAQSS
jgi:hypothetical protein